MQETFATIPVRNSRVLCIGGITRSETREAKASGLDVQDDGHYLYLASESEPTAPIEILAKFLSIEQAERAADMFPINL